ncbi:MAG: Peptidyl-tRNA hydrolase ArfB [Planctomycetes bacterium]|nr:Peptidyl-tRNA hydrolase ArfB [Planctomycetota bacterium]
MMPGPLKITQTISIPEREIEFVFARSGGPGGQNVNKVSSKAVLHFDVTRSPSLPPEVRARACALFAARINAEGRLVIACSTSASQLQNRQECLTRLQQMLQQAAQPPKVRKKTTPSRASRQRRLESKKRQSGKKAQRRKSWDSGEE